MVTHGQQQLQCCSRTLAAPPCGAQWQEQLNPRWSRDPHIPPETRVPTVPTAPAAPPRPPRLCLFLPVAVHRDTRSPGWRSCSALRGSLRWSPGSRSCSPCCLWTEGSSCGKSPDPWAQADTRAGSSPRQGHQGRERLSGHVPRRLPASGSYAWTLRGPGPVLQQACGPTFTTAHLPS